jgi:aspartate-semialdehyde dehydrogenase
MIRCAIVGATGLVGRTFLKVLEEKKLKIDEYELFASSKSKGKKVKFMDKEYTVQELTEDSFENSRFDYALFSAGSNVSKQFAPLAVKSGCTVIDNSSCWRMQDDVPLVVSEVNPKDIFKNKGIIANPNCSTIQAMLPIKALNDEYTISRIVFSTYQAVSGAGNAGISDLVNTRNGSEPSKFRLQHRSRSLIGPCIVQSCRCGGHTVDAGLGDHTCVPTRVCEVCSAE